MSYWIVEVPTVSTNKKIYAIIQGELLWRASLNGDFHLVRKILSMENANPNWENLQMHVSRVIIIVTLKCVF